MQYFYDINLHFEDNYVNYHLWDYFEHYNRLPIFRVINVRDILDNNVKIETEYKNIIVSDGVIALALEMRDNLVNFVSSLPYDAEFKINKLVMTFPEFLEVNIISKKDTKLINNIAKVKRVILDKIKNGDRSFIKFFYYEVTGKESDNLKYMREYLSEELINNFSDKYYKIYDIIMIGD